MASYSIGQPNAKAICTACKSAIQSLSFTEEVKLRTRSASKHMHLGCVDLAKLPDTFSIGKLSGFKDLNKAEQAEVRKTLKQKADDSDQKKTTAKVAKATTPPKSASKAVKPKPTSAPKAVAVKQAKPASKKPKAAKSSGVYSADEKAKLLQLKEDLSDKTVDQLKAMSRLNDQKITGSKKELIDRIADGIVLGAIPKCLKCGGGRPRFDANKGTYKCPGYMEDEDYVNCNKTFTMADLPRTPWVFN